MDLFYYIPMEYYVLFISNGIINNIIFRYMETSFLQKNRTQDVYFFENVYLVIARIIVPYWHTIVSIGFFLSYKEWRQFNPDARFEEFFINEED